jgi:8-oxo-dGTP diphosphatase
MTKELKAGEQFVVGFLFEVDGNRVLLIEKKRPDWQRERLNGVGGRVEDGEDPYAAMRREFTEEAGVEVSDWYRFALLNDRRGWSIHFFSAFNSTAFDAAHPMTDEALRRFFVWQRDHLPVIPNLRWLIPMALSINADGARGFLITEE